MDKSAVLLMDPKYPHNVGGALRACACFGVPKLRWVGDRVIVDRDRRKISAGAAGASNSRKGDRLPREERLRVFSNQVDWERGDSDNMLRDFIASGYTPVCVELDETAESLPTFVHPENPVYVFGPEDGSVPKIARSYCFRFVTIPTRTCLNLAAAINVVLYDRATKAGVVSLSETLDRQVV